MMVLSKFSKKSFFEIFLLIIVTAIVASLSFEMFSIVSAQKNESPSPTDYKIDIILLDVGDIDYTNGSFDVTFWLKLSNDEINFLDMEYPELEFDNAKEINILHEEIREHRYESKIHGSFFTDIDFRNYPFLDIDLKIFIEPAFDTIDKVLLSYDKNSEIVDLEHFHISGFKLTGTSRTLDAHPYEEFGEFSQFIATYSISTPGHSAFMVGIFPIIILGVVSLMSFLVDPTNHDIKLELSTGVLIAAVFFHVLDVGESLPPLEYLTLEDKAMTILYVMVVFAMMEVPIQRKFNEKIDYEKAKKINKKIRYMLPVIIAITTFAVFSESFATLFVV